MKESKGIGYGKAILFGEHFVVYGIPGIAAAIGLNTTCTFGKNRKGEEGITSNDLATGETIKYGQHSYKKLDQVISTILRETSLREKDFRLGLSTNMSLKGGMGSSAALCVSITKCLNKEFGLGLGNERVNDIAYEAEKIFHGNPSGIDNTVSCFGGMIWFAKHEPKNLVEKLSVEKPVEVVLADTGIVHDTAEIVAMVKRQKEKEPRKYEKIFKEYREMVYVGRKQIESSQWVEVGKLMSKNHYLLKQIGVSSKENDLLAEVCLEAGALGAKVTGAGAGGNNIALTPGKKLQEKVARACEKEGFMVYRTLIGVRHA